MFLEIRNFLNQKIISSQTPRKAYTAVANYLKGIYF